VEPTQSGAVYGTLLKGHTNVKLGCPGELVIMVKIPWIFSGVSEINITLRPAFKNLFTLLIDAPVK
jgi:hypothetical protein